MTDRQMTFLALRMRNTMALKMNAFIVVKLALYVRRQMLTARRQSESSPFSRQHTYSLFFHFFTQTIKFCVRKIHVLGFTREYLFLIFFLI